MAKNNNAMKVGVVATAIGAALGAAAIVLSDKENRKKMTKKAQELQKEAGKQLKTLQQNAQPMLDKATSVLNKPEVEKVAKSAEKAEKAVEEKVAPKKAAETKRAVN